MKNQDYDFFKSINEQAIAASNAVLRSLIFINAGAAVAALAFIGNLVGNQSLNFKGKLADLTMPLLWFGWGIVAAMLAMISSYFTHYFVAAYTQATQPQDKRYLHIKRVFHVCGIIAALASLALFVGGMYQVRTAISVLPL